MKNVLNILKPLAPLCGLLLLVVADLALAQDGTRLSRHLDGHASTEVSAGFRFFTFAVAFAAVIFVVAALYAAYCLVWKKGPPAIQEVGWKGPGISLLIGGFLFSLRWTVLTSAATSTGVESNDAWQRLQGSVEQVESHYVHTERAKSVFVENELA